MTCNCGRYPHGKLFYRKRGIPKRIKSIVKNVTAYDLEFVEGEPKAKVVIFKNRRDMHRFYNVILPEYRNAVEFKCNKLDKRALGCVNSLVIHYTKGSLIKHEVDKRYFCIVLLIEGYLTAEVLVHEGVHVGFAWDWRMKGDGPYSDPNNDEENTCYITGIFVDKLITCIKQDALKET